MVISKITGFSRKSTLEVPLTEGKMKKAGERKDVKNSKRRSQSRPLIHGCWTTIQCSEVEESRASMIQRKMGQLESVKELGKLLEVRMHLNYPLDSKSRI